MKIDKINTEETFVIKEDISEKIVLRFTIINNKAITISNYKDECKFVFLDSKPEVVAKIADAFSLIKDFLKERGIIK